MCANVECSLFLRYFIFVCVSVCVCMCLAFLFESAIPLVRTEMLFSLSNANPPLHFAFLHSSPFLYTKAPFLNSHSNAATHTDKRIHKHTHSLSSLPVMLCCLSFPP